MTAFPAVAAPAQVGPLVDAAWLAARLSDPALVVLDVTVDLPRPRHDGDHQSRSGRPGWAATHIPTARHLDLLDEFAEPGATYHFAHPTVARARAVLERLGVDDASTVVLYDSADGFWSARAWWSLRGLGLHALVLDGGLTEWEAAGHGVERGNGAADAPVASRSAAVSSSPGASAPASEAPLTLVEDPSVWATRQDVIDIVAGTHPATLVCALGADQFTGEATTRYSRRGHIPTSVNLPARDLARDAGRLLDGPELLRAVGRALPDEDAEIVLYCGGGISASYAALGLVSAGRSRVRVYDGSLEEWSADPDLPLVLGDGTGVGAAAG